MSGEGVDLVCERTVESFDGTRLACREAGSGPVIMLANGLGGTWTAWRHLIDYFRDRFRIVSWDYRGLYRSGPSATPGAYGMETQVADAFAVADACGVREAIWAGWSMGVQLDFEIVARAPERVRGLIAINGTWGRPFDTAFGWSGARQAIPLFGRVVRSAPRLFSAALRPVAAWDGMIDVATRLGLVGRTLDRRVFHDLAAEFGRLDLDAYFATFLDLGDHDAGHVLETIRCPVLIVAGDSDPMTPRSLSEEMARRIPGAELLIVRGGTHYVPVEFPELTNLRLERFFRERGLLPTAGQAAGAGATGAAALRQAGRT
jgi:pimeloyl-ACP methyl ester carboxylesterase